MKKHIFLTGFMGSGKTTLGKKLAQKTDRIFYDSDKEIEIQCGKSINEIFNEEGEQWFRKVEEKQIDKICKSSIPAVISLGGGALMSQNNIDRVRSSGLLVYIKISPEEIYHRVYSATNRPLLKKNGAELRRKEYLQNIKELLKAREPGYAAAHIVLNNDNLTVKQAVDILINKLGKIL
jgi:shikimate kinase